MKKAINYSSQHNILIKKYKEYIEFNAPYKALQAALKHLDANVFTYDFLEDAVFSLNKLPIIRNEQGLLSPSAILEAIKDTELYSLLAILDSIARSRFYTKGAKMKQRPILGSLTPLALYALKRDKGIMYEEWDKTDPNIIRFTGKVFKDIIEPIDVTDNIREDISDILAYPRTNNICGIKRLPAILLGQLWLANVEFRCEASMILDPNNWDNVPEPLDEVVQKSVIKPSMDMVW